MIALFLVIVLAGGSTLADQSTRRYEITITNLTRGQIFSPPIVISHDWNFQLFKLGDAASPQLAALAEEGDPSLLIDQVDLEPGLNYAVSDGPVLPGKSVVLEVSAVKRARWISVAGMLVTTNDGFFAVRDLVVPLKREITVEADAYDAGSERNSEDCAFIPGPPCGSHNAHDPADAEDYVYIHAGIHGIGPDPDLVNPSVYDWRNPVAQITVRPIR
jgi:hypothetical protein